jgi:hypothetical protein
LNRSNRQKLGENIKESWILFRRLKLNAFFYIISGVHVFFLAEGFHSPPGTHRTYVELCQRRPLGRLSWQVKCLIRAGCSTPGVSPSNHVPPLRSIKQHTLMMHSTCMEYSVACVAVQAVDHRAGRLASSIARAAFRYKNFCKTAV